MPDRILGFFIVCALILAPPACFGQQNADCMGCHENGLMGAPRVNAKKFASSAHAGHSCVSCHVDIQKLPHKKKSSRVRCKNCHAAESIAYWGSTHGRAVRSGRSGAAVCHDCHANGHFIPRISSANSPVNRKNVPATCGRCHDDPQRMLGADPTELNPFESYSRTVHGESFTKGNLRAAVCTDCHGAHHLRRAADSRSKVFWRNIPFTCSRCHRKVGKAYAISVHSRAAMNGHKEAPVCTSCHGEHTIHPHQDPASSVSVGAVTKTCSGCHASAKLAKKFDLPVNRIKTYMGTYHGLAQKRGDLHVANCASCHGFHDILPHTDPASSINRRNLSKTCGKCHAGAGRRLAKGRIHSSFYHRHISVRVATWFYWLLIPLVIGGMLFHNGLDFIKKLFLAGPPAEHPHAEIRMTLNERIQHAGSALAFIALAYTGFALKFPESWWALPMSFVDENIRRWAHRGTAVLFCVVGVHHLVYMSATRRGRKVLFGLLPRPRDLMDALQLMAYNAGLRKSRPQLAQSYNYIEKSEYWALIWGSIVMLVSGAVLAFTDLTLRIFPMWVPDLATTVHYYEAVLACLAIIVWHLYWVIFDPDVYPMNRAWLTGFVRPRRRR